MFNTYNTWKCSTLTSILKHFKLVSIWNIWNTWNTWTFLSVQVLNTFKCWNGSKWKLLFFRSSILKLGRLYFCVSLIESVPFLWSLMTVCLLVGFVVVLLQFCKYNMVIFDFSFPNLWSINSNLCLGRTFMIFLYLDSQANVSVIKKCEI